MKPHSPLTSVFLFIVLAVVCTLLVFRQQNVVKYAREQFGLDTDPKYNPVPITALNNMFCKTRNIMFANNNHIRKRASQRSIENNFTGQHGCGVVESVSQDMALVHENYIYYNLMRACMSLSVHNIQVRNINGTNTVVVTVDTRIPIDNSSDSFKMLLDILLLNPIFLEFGNGNKSTPAYFISGEINNVSSLDRDSSYELYLLPLGQQSTDPFFDYGAGANLVNLESMVNDIPSNGSKVFNVTVYYLDPQKSPNSQGFFRTLPLVYNAVSKTALILNSALISSGTASSESDKNFDFYKLLKTYYEYKLPPIFNMRFVIDSDALGNMPETRTVIARMYMGPPPSQNLSSYLGYYGANCWSHADDQVSNSINNIFSLVAKPYDGNTTRLYLITGVDNKCHKVLDDNEDNIVNDPHTVHVDIPVIKERMDVTLTISPTEKGLVVYWTSADKTLGDNSRSTNFAISRKRACATQQGAYNNNFYKLFVDTTSKIVLQDIVFQYSTDYIADLKELKLGYENLYSHVYNR